MYLDFLKAYKQWLDDGAVQGRPFTRDNGLCINLLTYLGSHEPMFEHALHRRLKHLYGDTEYPFNKRSSRHYVIESNKARCHLNPDRNAFVEAEIERLS